MKSNREARLLDEVWSVLLRLTKLRFEARSEAGTGWNGVGVGTIAVSEPAAETIVFEEVGTWRQLPNGRSDFRFTNVYRWVIVEDRIRLEHLRFGPKQPVYLFDLAPGEDGCWHEVQPHLCREDEYTASLAIDGNQLQLSWIVEGPQKRESICYVYS